MTEAAKQPDGPAAEQQQETAKVTRLPRTHYRYRHLLRALVRFALMVALPLAAVLCGAELWAEGLRYVSTENAYVKANKISVSTDIDGRVIEVAVHDNQRVERGQLLFRLDPEPFQLAVDGKRAELEAVRHDIAAKRTDYSAGQRAVEQLRELVNYLERERARAAALARRGVASAARLDEASHDLEMAKRELLTRQESNRSILAWLGAAADGPAERHPDYQRRLAELDRAELDLERTSVLAPADGVLSNVTLRLGEYVEEGEPVFSLVEADNLWVEANLKETQLTHVKLGQEASLVADAYPDVTYHAVIESISPATGAEFALLPPQNASGNWVKVVQRVPVRLRVEPAPDQPHLRAGMTVTVTVDTERRRTLGLVLGDWLREHGLDSYIPGPVLGWLSA